MDDPIQKRFDALFRELEIIKKSSGDTQTSIKEIHAKIDPIIQIYETWKTLGKWSRPFLVALSLLIAIFTGIITLVGAIKGHLK